MDKLSKHEKKALERDWSFMEKRLTECRDGKSGFITCRYCDNLNCRECVEFRNYAEKLSFYEWLEENGRLAILRFPMGMSLFEIRNIFGESKIIEHIIDGSYSLNEIERLWRNDGKAIFFSLALAEAALASMARK